MESTLTLLRQQFALWQNPRMGAPAKSSIPVKQQGNRSLRDQVDELLPGWQSWYPSLFDAAQDLGILRARVCDLSTLVLSNRHASVYNEAVQAFRNQWSVEEPEQSSEQEHHGRRAHRHDNRHQHRAHRPAPDDASVDESIDDGPDTTALPDDLL